VTPEGPEGTPQGPVRASRATRIGRRRRSRAIAVVAAVAVVAAGIWFVVAGGGDDGGAASPGATNTAADTGTHLMTFSVTGGTSPDMAVIGVHAGTSGAIPIPPELTIVVPGQGETLSNDVARLPGPSQQVALSNEVGAWTKDLAVLSVRQLATVVDRAGGLSVNLPEVVPTSAGVLGPGLTKLSGRQLTGLLTTKNPDDGSRWRAVLTALLATPPVFTPADLTSVSTVTGVNRLMEQARAARLITMPTEDVAGLSLVSSREALDHLMGVTFGTPMPVPAIVQNGNGTAGVGEIVGRRIIPAGFRVTLSQNAQSNVPATSIIANGPDQEQVAQRARKALGLGRVVVSQVASGIGDITIVVGKDFTA
jgi:hypothetical protein